MQVPRRLHLKSDRKTLCEPNDPESAFVLIGKGQSMTEPEARRYGVQAYLDRMAAKALEVPDTKAIDQSEVEDKAIDASDVSNKGVDFPAETRRLSGVKR